MDAHRWTWVAIAAIGLAVCFSIAYHNQTLLMEQAALEQAEASGECTCPPHGRACSAYARREFLGRVWVEYQCDGGYVELHRRSDEEKARQASDPFAAWQKEPTGT